MDFVTFEIAKKLKEKGFQEECLAYYTSEYTLYNNTICLTEDKYLCVCDIDYEEFLKSNNQETKRENICDAPTISQVLKWLRKEKHLHIELVAAAYGYNYIVSQTPEDGGTDYYSSAWEYAGPNDGGAWDSDEQAALAGIEYTLNYLI